MHRFAASVEDPLSFLIGGIRITHDLAIRHPHHIADADLIAPTGEGAIDRDTLLTTEIQHLVVVIGKIERYIPAEVPGLHRRTAHQDFYAVVADITDILHGLVVAGAWPGRNLY